MDEQQLVDLLIQNIQYQLRHPHYDRTQDRRAFAGKMINDRDQKDDVTRYRRYEDSDLKDQRFRLYNSITGYALKRIEKYWRKASSIEGLKPNILTKNKDGLQKLHENFENFHQRKDLRTFLADHLVFCSSNDANRFIIYERIDLRDAEGGISKTIVYPFMVSSIDVLNYEERRGILQWLIVREIEIETIYKKSVKVDRVLETYFLYAPGYHIRMREKGERTIVEAGETELPPMKVHGNAQPSIDEKTGLITNLYGTVGNRVFLLSVLQNGTTEVPAMSCGAYVDDITEQRTYVPWFNAAEHVLQDIIRDKSLEDVHKIIHAFPKRWEFVKGCKYVDPKDNAECHGRRGIGGDPKRICPECGNTGKPQNFASEQTIVQLVWPEGGRASDLAELSKLAFVEPSDVDLAEQMAKQVEVAEARILNAVLSAGVIEQASGAKDKLATEYNYAYEDLYDVLRPFLNTISRHFELAYRIGAQYLEIDDLVVSDHYPKDLKMKSVASILESLEKAKTGGASYEFIAAQQRALLEKQYVDDPIMVERVLARYQFLPFADKGETELAMILASLAPTDYYRVLRTYWLEIFTEIEYEDKEIAGADDNPNDSRKEFYQLSFAFKKAIISKKVKEYTARIEQASAAEPDLGNAAADGNQDTQPTAQ